MGSHRSVPSVFDLRKVARRSIEAARSAGDSKVKRLFTEIAFEAAQLAERLESNGNFTRTDLEFYASLTQKMRRGSALPSADAGSAVFEDLLGSAIGVMVADMGYVQKLDRESQSLRIVASCGFERSFLDFFAVVERFDSSACAFALHTASRVVVRDTVTSPFFVGKCSEELLQEARVRAVQCSPLVGHDGSLIGMLSTHWHEPFKPSQYMLVRLDQLIADSADGLEAAMSGDNRH
ncbi:MAG TPA: GAF domain-containing protein [Rhizomicrobium sp.]|nr:GAF domain-containing protein [Rhizomicrobium sp.]